MLKCSTSMDRPRKGDGLGKWLIVANSLHVLLQVGYFRTYLCLGIVLISPCAFLNAYVTYTWKTTHLVKLRHLGLTHYHELTPTFKQVGLIPAVDFPSGSKPCCTIFHFRPNHKLCLVQGLSVPSPTPGPPS
jgi:hypothetical protein